MVRLDRVQRVVPDLAEHVRLRDELHEHRAPDRWLDIESGATAEARTARAALWLGQAASVTGDRLSSVVVTWTTLTISRSPLAVGLLSLAGSVPFLESSLDSGAVADRRDALRLPRIVDLGRAMIMMVLPVAAASGGLSLGCCGFEGHAGVAGRCRACSGPQLRGDVGEFEPVPLPRCHSAADGTQRFEDEGLDEVQLEAAGAGFGHQPAHSLSPGKAAGRHSTRLRSPIEEIA